MADCHTETGHGAGPRGILAGIRVLDYAFMQSGPSRAMMLAGHGAEIIKLPRSSP